MSLWRVSLIFGVFFSNLGEKVGKNLETVKILQAVSKLWNLLCNLVYMYLWREFPLFIYGEFFSNFGEKPGKNLERQWNFLSSCQEQLNTYKSKQMITSSLIEKKFSRKIREAHFRNLSFNNYCLLDMQPYISLIFIAHQAPL